MYIDTYCVNILCTMINIEVKKKDGEHNSGILRRFTRKVQNSGILPRVRGIRYDSRPETKFKRKKKTIKALKFSANLEEQIKLGKIPMPRHRR